MKWFFAEWLRASIKGLIPFLLLLAVIFLTIGAFTWSIGFGFIVMFFLLIVYFAFLITYFNFWNKW